MKNFNTRSRLVLALLLAASTSAYAETTPSSPATTLAFGELRFAPCSLRTQLSRDSLEAQCTRFSVPENRDEPDGRKIELNIAWLEATERGDVSADAVFFLAGGPGQSAVETYPMLDPAFTEVRKHRHVILVDQRGTGKSNALSCKGDDNAAEQEPTPEAMRTQAQQCADELSKRADLRHYTTTDAVADLDAVRQALGLQLINLVGVSYGTRVAQQYAMRHPDATRSIVLDSVVPNTLGLGNIFARNLDDALSLQFALCSDDPQCKEKLGDPRAELDTLLNTLRAAPANVNYRDATSGEWEQGVLRADTVAGLVRMYAYMPMASALLPKLIHEANAGRYEELMALAKLMSGDMQDAMAMGMQLSVVCSEDADSMVAREEDADTVLGNLMSTGMAAMCDVWPKGTMPKDFHSALATDVPALVLEGEFDPVTPPQYGKQVVEHLPNGRLFVLKGQGHNVIAAGCMPKLFAQFIERKDAKALDGACLDTLPYAPPFTSFNGAEP
jgi:pimeloyl-ACP methyl ester carboxylesterase